MLACCIVSAVVLGLISHLQTSPARRRWQPLIASGSPAILLLQKVGRAPTSASYPTISSCLWAIFRTTSTTRSLSNFSQVSSIVSLRVFHTSYTPFTWYNRFDNCVERTATVRSTGCQTGLYNQLDNRLYTRYSRLSDGFDNRLYCVYKHFNRLSKRFDNRLYRVNGAWLLCVRKFLENMFWVVQK